MKQRKAFTLIEILIVIGLIAVLAGVLVVALNPARQFSQARNAQRWNHMDTMIGALIAETTDNRGVTTCTGIPVSPAAAGTISSAGVNLAACLVPTYAASLPVDPSSGTWTSAASYDTGYTILVGTDGRTTIDAPGAELEEDISITR